MRAAFFALCASALGVAGAACKSDDVAPPGDGGADGGVSDVEQAYDPPAPLAAPDAMTCAPRNVLPGELPPRRDAGSADGGEVHCTAFELGTIEVCLSGGDFYDACVAKDEGLARCAACLVGGLADGKPVVRIEGAYRLSLAACFERLAVSPDEVRCAGEAARFERCLDVACSHCLPQADAGGADAADAAPAPSSALYSGCRELAALGAHCKALAPTVPACLRKADPDAGLAPCTVPGSFRTGLFRYAQLFCGGPAQAP